MAKNKIIYGGTVLIDLTSDTATADQILDGYTAHINTGEQVEGTCTYDADTSDATAQVAEILSGKTAYANGAKITGTMPNRGAIDETIDDADDVITVPQGYHDGSGTVQISAAEVAKLKNHANIKAGVTILGETGTYSGEAISAQSKTVNPATTAQTVLPDTGYDYLSQVVVNAISYVETPNAHGTTVTIAGN